MERDQGMTAEFENQIGCCITGQIELTRVELVQPSEIGEEQDRVEPIC